MLSLLALSYALASSVVVQAQALTAVRSDSLLPAVTQLKQPVLSDETAGGASRKRYAFDDLGFSIAFPSAPRGGSTPNPGFGKSEAYNHLIVAGADDGLYMVFCVTGMPFASEQLSPAQRDGIFRAVWQDLTKTITAELEKSGSKARVTPGEERAATLGTLAGREQDLKFGLKSARIRAALRNNRMYVVVTVNNSGALAANRNAFFNSFTLTQRR